MAGSNYREVNSLRNVQAYTVYRECSIHMKKAFGTINQRQGEREGGYFPQYNKIYVELNDNNKTKWRVAGKAQGPS